MTFHDDQGYGHFVISFTASPRKDFGVFAEGYRRAASKLAKDLLSRPRFADYDAYPVVFLYRHSLELYLKHTIYSAALLAAFRQIDQIDAALHKTHDLKSLSERVSMILHRVFPAEFGLLPLCEKIRQVSEDLSDIDANSYSYRYPIDNNGDYSTRPHQRVTLSSLYERMTDLLDDMDALDLGLQVERDKAQETYEILCSLFGPESG